MRSPFSVRQLVMQWLVFSLVFHRCIPGLWRAGESGVKKNVNVSLASMFGFALCRLVQYGKYMFLFVSVVLYLFQCQTEKCGWHLGSKTDFPVRTINCVVLLYAILSNCPAIVTSDVFENVPA